MCTKIHDVHLVSNEHCVCYYIKRYVTVNVSFRNTCCSYAFAACWVIAWLYEHEHMYMNINCAQTCSDDFQKMHNYLLVRQYCVVKLTWVTDSCQSVLYKYQENKLYGNGYMTYFVMLLNRYY